MKALLLLLLFWANVPLVAQKRIEEKLRVKPGQKVELDLKFADSIRVKYWDQPEVSVVILVTINDGKLNDALTVKTSETESAVKLTVDLDKRLVNQSKSGAAPGEKDMPQITSTDILYDVYLPRNAPLDLSTINGNVLLDGAGAPVMAKSISGFVDMSWPDPLGANLFLKSITGEVYSNLAIEFKGKVKNNPMVGYNILGKAKDGGPMVHLESVSNNVYLRKK